MVVETSKADILRIMKILEAVELINVMDVYDFIEENPGSDIWVITDGLGLTLSTVIEVLAQLEMDGMIYARGFSWYIGKAVEEEVILGYEAEMDDKTCDKCRSYHGQTFTPEEAEQEFGEWLDKSDPNIWYPNVHPNCRCRLVVMRIKIMMYSEEEEDDDWLEEDDEELERRKRAGNTGRESLLLRPSPFSSKRVGLSVPVTRINKKRRNETK